MEQNQLEYKAEIVVNQKFKAALSQYLVVLTALPAEASHDEIMAVTLLSEFYQLLPMRT